MAMHNANKLKIGLFGANCSSGRAVTCNQPHFAIAGVHGLAGLITVLFGTFVALRANELVPGALRFDNFKLFMRTAYSAYMTVTSGRDNALTGILNQRPDVVLPNPYGSGSLNYLNPPSCI